MITDKELKASMHKLLEELSNSTSKETDGKIIAKAVNLGMKYQESKIKSGIDIVFQELNR